MISNEILEKIRAYASIGHTPRQITSMLRVPATDVHMILMAFEDQGSAVFEMYYLGRTQAAYNQNTELTKLAEKGDTFAIERLDERKQAQEAEDLRRELFGI